MNEIKFIEIQIDDLNRCLHALTKMGDTYISVTPFRILMTKRRIKKFEKVKQNLEVLEIIMEKKVDVYYLHTLLKNGQVDVVLNRYNIYARDRALTMGELLKLKQWLGVDENA